MKNRIGCSRVKQHNDDRETVRGRSESVSAGKAYDSSKSSCKGGLYLLWIVTMIVPPRLPLFFILTGDGINLTSKACSL